MPTCLKPRGDSMLRPNKEGTNVLGLGLGQIITPSHALAHNVTKRGKVKAKSGSPEVVY